MNLSNALHYTAGYKYRTSETFWVFTNYRPEIEIRSGRITLTREGLLIVGAGYSSDGPSGPTLNSGSLMMNATGFHDPVYELLRKGAMEGNTRIMQPVKERLGIVKGVYAISNEEQQCLARVPASHEALRLEADRFLIDLLLSHGMWRWRAMWIYQALRSFGAASARDRRKAHVTLRRVL